LFISENRGDISGIIPKSEGFSTEIPNAFLSKAKTRKLPALLFQLLQNPDYAESPTKKGRIRRFAMEPAL
jgi:hypothetical protein